jgi:hypothetical protein
MPSCISAQFAAGVSGRIFGMKMPVMGYLAPNSGSWGWGWGWERVGWKCSSKSNAKKKKHTREGICCRIGPHEVEPEATVGGLAQAGCAHDDGGSRLHGVRVAVLHLATNTVQQVSSFLGLLSACGISWVDVTGGAENMSSPFFGRRTCTRRERWRRWHGG